MGQFYEANEAGKVTATALKVSALSGIAHLSTGDLTASPVALATSDVSGILPLANGGTAKSSIAIDKIWYSSAANVLSEASITTFGRSLIDDADNVAARVTLGLVINTNVQAYDAGLLSIAGLTTAADTMIYTTALDAYAITPLTAAGRALMDDASATAQRGTLGLGSIATQDSSSVSISGGSITGGTITGITDLAIVDGGTGASSAVAALNNLLPAQAGNAGKYVHTDGLGVVSWQVPQAFTPIRWIAQGEAMVVNKVVQTMVEKAGTVAEVLMRADVAPVGGNIQIDIRRNGSSIFTTMPAIGAGFQAKTITEVFNGTNVLAKGDILTLDIKTVGTTTSGGDDLLVTLVMA